MKSHFKVIIFLFLLSTTLFAQQDLGSGWSINGQVQLRSELDGRDFSNRTHPLTFASSRISLGVQKTFQKKLTLYIQIQDSRVFGSESGTLSSSKNLDLHQGYVKLNNLFNWNWTIQAGRFEINYGTERFIGPVGWHYIGRSFDGIRFVIAPKTLNLHLFGVTIKESVGYIGNAKPGIYPYPQEPTPSRSIYGFWEKLRFNDDNKLDIFGYWDIDRQRVNGSEDTSKLSMPTVGSSYWGTFGKLSVIGEAAYQFGDMAGKDISAYLVSAIAFYKSGSTKLGLGIDLLSGTNTDDASTRMNSFQATYGTNHKFYGFMDYFINIPGNTLNLGLNDFYLMSFYKPRDSKWGFGANVHHFMSNQSANITVGDNTSLTEENSFGQEIDLTVKYAFIKGTTLVWGGSVFFPGNLMKYMFAPREDVAYWTYFMISANL
ncbi:MAG: alginate export family protein [Ignavibacteria bacterium]|nr:MAG: alginate export family protein [Ignavibacteria bacterium]